MNAVASTSIDIVSCPLCAWAHEVKPLDPRLNASTLASVFGTGIMLQSAINQRTAETERALESHLKTHTLVEWVSEITRAKQEARQHIQTATNLAGALITLRAAAGDLEESFDKTIYPELVKEDCDALDDHEYTVSITAKLWRSLGRALSDADRVINTQSMRVQS